MTSGTSPWRSHPELPGYINASKPPALNVSLSGSPPLSTQVPIILQLFSCSINLISPKPKKIRPLVRLFFWPTDLSWPLPSYLQSCKLDILPNYPTNLSLLLQFSTLTLPHVYSETRWRGIDGRIRKMDSRSANHSDKVRYFTIGPV